MACVDSVSQVVDLPLSSAAKAEETIPHTHTHTHTLVEQAHTFVFMLLSSHWIGLYHRKVIEDGLVGARDVLPR